MLTIRIFPFADPKTSNGKTAIDEGT